MKALPLAAAAAVLQILALAYLAGEREWIVRTGTTIYLRTAPIDPRDVMRGDYVQLDYEASRVPHSVWKDDLAAKLNADLLKSSTRVYASLRANQSGSMDVVSLTDRKPASGLFIRGRIEPQSRWGEGLRVRYGIEAWFMEQGEAKQLEQQRAGALRGVPLQMEVALGRNGIAVLKGYRWESLGINLNFGTVRRTNLPTGFRQVQDTIVGAKVELKNHGPDPVAIVDLPEGRSFGLVCDPPWQEPAYRWIGETNAVPPPAPGDVIVLQPGQSHTNQLDLTRPEWFVVDIRTNAATRQPKPLQQLENDWSNGFRIEYRPPPAEACTKLSDAKLIWHGRVKSSRFNPTGRVD